jgi:hypothetical protein
MRIPTTVPERIDKNTSKLPTGAPVASVPSRPMLRQMINAAIKKSPAAMKVE